ncbi:MAG: hypothetical protein A2148_07560 [Chloroflexi bacterium RBG_16_68_14]|nr:MAG: hypothetical protein A2148_07560 [Chloroflexi bacterium RBG_16_68_14]
MTSFGDADIQRIRAAVAALVDEHHLPGISVGVVSGDELVYAEGFGYADIESQRPQDPALRQRIGSITKTMTALCAMALVEEVRLSLDDRVVDHLPDVRFHGPAEQVTVRHVLTHTSGIGEVPMPEDIRKMDDTLWSDVDAEVPGVPEAYPNGITIEVPPGSKWAYANHAFVLLGEIVARTEKTPIEQVLRRRVFEPLGMANTDCLDRPHPDLTTGYHRPPSEDQRELMARIGQEPPQEEPSDGHNIRGRYQRVRGAAAGAVQSTIPDMARYASALLRKSAGIVRPETFDTMLAPQWCPDERLQNIGLAFFREHRFGRFTFGHGGGVTGGWNTHLGVLPDDGLAVLVHLNLAYEKFDEIDGRILQAVLDAPDPKPLGAPIDPAILAAAPGVYEAAPGTLTNYRIIGATGRVQISLRDGELWLHARRGPWKQGARMLPADANDPAFFVLDRGEPEPPHIALLLDGTRAVAGLRFDRLVEMVRNDHVEPWA